MQRVGAWAWAAVLVGLLLPSTFAETPRELAVDSTWQIRWPDGRSLEMRPVERGWSVEDLADGREQLVITEDEPFEINVLEEDDERFLATVRAEGAHAEWDQLLLSGRLDRVTGTARLALYSRDGAVIAEGIEVESPPSVGLDGTLIIVVSGTAAVSLVGIIACTVVDLAQNCLTACESACSDSGGMQAARDGHCGTCECFCGGNG